MADKRGRQTTDAVEILRRRFVEGDAESEALLEETRAKAEVARTIHRLRSGAKLTQQALAERVGTTASGKGGRRKKLGEKQRAVAVDLYRQKKHTIDEICKAVGK